MGGYTNQPIKRALGLRGRRWRALFAGPALSIDLSIYLSMLRFKFVCAPSFIFSLLLAGWLFGRFWLPL